MNRPRKSSFQETDFQGILSNFVVTMFSRDFVVIMPKKPTLTRIDIWLARKMEENFRLFVTGYASTPIAKGKGSG